MRARVYLLCIRCFASSRFFSGSSHVHSCSGWRMIWEWLCSVCLAFCSPYTPRMEMYRSPRIDMNLVKQLWKLPFFHACAEQSWAEPFSMCICASVCVCLYACVYKRRCLWIVLPADLPCISYMLKCVFRCSPLHSIGDLFVFHTFLSRIAITKFIQCSKGSGISLPVRLWPQLEDNKRNVVATIILVLSPPLKWLISADGHSNHPVWYIHCSECCRDATER